MIKLGFIGVGGYGRYQLEGFLPFQAKGRISIRALADPAPMALAAFASQLPRAETFLDYREMLERAELDAVVICAPIHAHKEIALRAVQRDLHVLLEKPPVPLFSDLKELIAADRHCRVMVAFQHIYKPLARRMKEAVARGEIGRPIAISAHGLWPRPSEYYERSSWAGELFLGGQPVLDGPCTNAMAHFLNSLFFLAGREPAEFARPESLSGEAYRARPVASYDVGAVRGTLERGMRFSALFSHAVAEKTPVRISIVGTEGEVELRDDATRYRDPSGEIFSGSDGRDELRQAFLSFVEGEAEKNLTGLSAMEPYLLATNLMFQSSGGIHTIAPGFVEVHQPGTPDAIYAVRGLRELFRSSSERMNSFREIGMPWALKPRVISASDFNESQMLDFLSESLSVQYAQTSG